MSASAHNKNLRRLLEGRLQRARGEGSFVLPLDLFDAFNTADMDVNGATCSGYSDSGLSVKVQAIADLTALTVFPCPGVTCEVNASLGGSRCPRLMLILRRMPRSMGPSLGFFQYEGVRWDIAAGAGVEFAIGPPDFISDQLKIEVGEGKEAAEGEESDEGPEEIALELEASASANLKFGGQYFSAIAATPEFYERCRDGQLQRQFDALMPEWHRDEVKEQAVEFLNKIAANSGLGGGHFSISPSTRLAIPGIRSKYATAELLRQLGNIKAGPFLRDAEWLKARLNAFQKSEKKQVKNAAIEWLGRHAPAVKTSGSFFGNIPSSTLQQAIAEALPRVTDQAELDAGRAITSQLSVYSGEKTDEEPISKAAANRRDRWKGLKTATPVPNCCSTTVGSIAIYSWSSAKRTTT